MQISWKWILISLLFFQPLHSIATAEEPESGFQKTADGKLEFYSVLDVLLHRFSKDLNSLDTKIDKMSPYKISLQGELPDSFRETLLGKIEESVTNNSKIRMVKCISCFQTFVTNEEEALVVRKGIQKSEDLRKIARELKVQFFMDGSFSLQPEEMVFSASLLDAYTGEVVWSHSYSSRDNPYTQKSNSTGKLGTESSVKLTSYRIDVAPGFLLLPGQGGDKAGYLAMSVSLLEFIGMGFLNRFGLAFTGFVPPPGPKEQFPRQLRVILPSLTVIPRPAKDLQPNSVTLQKY